MAERDRPTWTFLSNHGHVLMCLAADPDARLRDIAERVGVTERTVFGIVENLEQAGIVVREKVGRRNTYRIDRSRHLRHEIEANHTVGDLIDLLG
jgi:DNA-binding MarR family transcriptional regulator